jgi:hypothetical protein
MTNGTAQWQHWAAGSDREAQWRGDGVVAALVRQGQVWRALLSGEKAGTDMLGADDYVGAFRTLVARLVRHRPWVWGAAMLMAAAIAALIYLFVTERGTVQHVVAIGLSALAAVGISTAALKRALNDVTSEIEAQVWRAELDFAIAEAITVPAADWIVKLKKIELPAPRGTDPQSGEKAAT